jgi:glucokinase
MEVVDNIIGVDLGGTNIRAGRVIDRKIEKIAKKINPSDQSEHVILETIFSILDECINSNTKGIGIGVPGLVDVERGIVFDVVNIPSWNNVPLKEILENHYHIPVYINNDANCFAISEKYYGKGQDFQSIVGLTLGTGLGCGLVFNGQLYEGSNCGAGEFGEIQYLKHNFEYYCSGKFFFKEKGIDAESAFNHAIAGDTIYCEYFKEYGYHVGQVVKSLLYAYDPEIIILGGSLTKAFNLYAGVMLSAIQDSGYLNSVKKLQIEVSELDNSAIYGAAGLFLNSMNNSQVENGIISILK